MNDHSHIATATEELADWIERWRHEADALSIVSPVAKAWLEFVDDRPWLSIEELAAQLPCGTPTASESAPKRTRQMSMRLVSLLALVGTALPVATETISGRVVGVTDGDAIAVLVGRSSWSSSVTVHLLQDVHW